MSIQTSIADFNGIAGVDSRGTTKMKVPAENEGLRLWVAGQMTEEAKKFKATGKLDLGRLEQLTQALIVVDTSDLMTSQQTLGKDYRFQMNDMLKAMAAWRSSGKGGKGSQTAVEDSEATAFEKKLDALREAERAAK